MGASQTSAVLSLLVFLFLFLFSVFKIKNSILLRFLGQQFLPSLYLTLSSFVSVVTLLLSFGFTASSVSSVEP